MSVKPTQKKIGAETMALAELLGRLDCTFWPQFPIDGRNVTVCREWAKAWINGVGLPVRTSNANANERKAAENLWKTLERASLIVITSRKGRRSHVRFTQASETIARRLCATGDVFEYWEVFTAFAALCEELGESRIPASCVAGLEPWPGTPEAGQELGSQTFRFLPHATEGYVSFSTDTCNGLWLTLTSAGRKAIARPPTEPDNYDNWGLIEEASEIYEASFTAAKQELAVATPDRPNNFIIPGVPTGWGDFRTFLAGQRKRDLQREVERQASK